MMVWEEVVLSPYSLFCTHFFQLTGSFYCIQSKIERWLLIPKKQGFRNWQFIAVKQSLLDPISSVSLQHLIQQALFHWQICCCPSEHPIKLEWLANLLFLIKIKKWKIEREREKRNSLLDHSLWWIPKFYSACQLVKICVLLQNGWVLSWFKEFLITVHGNTFLKGLYFFLPSAKFVYILEQT